MEETLKLLSTPGFWIGSVVVGILVNFASQWMYGRLAALPGRWAAWAAKRSETRARRAKRDVETLLLSRELIPIYVGITLSGLVLGVAAVSTFVLLLQVGTLQAKDLGTIAGVPIAPIVPRLLMVIGAVIFFTAFMGSFDTAAFRLGVLGRVYRTIDSEARARLADPKKVVDPRPPE